MCAAACTRLPYGSSRTNPQCPVRSQSYKLGRRANAPRLRSRSPLPPKGSGYSVSSSQLLPTRPAFLSAS